MARTVPLILATFLLVPAATAAAQSAQDGPGIVTHGQATLDRAPDVAFVTVAAEVRAPVPAQAQGQAAEAMTAVQTALRSAGIPDDAIRTTGYSLRPDMRYMDGQSTVLGYIATNQIEVRVDELDQLGRVLDAAGGSGSTAISGLRFDLKARAEVEREALRLAVEDAMGRARAIADGAGKTLGNIVRIEDQSTTSGPPPSRMMMMRSDAAQVQTPVSPGELQISATVRLTVWIQ